MSDRGAELSSMYDAKVRAELADADYAAGLTAPSWSGVPLASIVAVKGVPGEAERAGEPVLSGADGEALRKALAALGEDTELLAVLSRSAKPEGDRERLRVQLASADPSVVIALDAAAAADVSEAFGVGGLPFGEPVRLAGTVLLAVDGLEESLGDESRKKRVWRQLQSLRGARSSAGRDGTEGAAKGGSSGGTRS